MSEDEFVAGAAEERLLAAIVGRLTLLTDVVTTVRAEDFSKPEYVALYSWLVEQYAQGETVVVAAEGGSHPLAPSILQASRHPRCSDREAITIARQVRESGLRRRLESIGKEVSALSGREGTLPDLARYARDLAIRLRDEVSAQTEEHQPGTAGDALVSFLEEAENLSGARVSPYAMTTGLTSLDAVIGGLEPHQVVLLSGRDGEGANQLLLQFARSATWTHSAASLVVSARQTPIQIVTRLYAAEFSISLNNIRRGEMTDGDWRKMADGVTQIGGDPLFVEGMTRITAGRLRSWIESLHWKHDLRLVALEAPAAWDDELSGTVLHTLDRLVTELDLTLVVERPLTFGEVSSPESVRADLGAWYERAELVILLQRARSPERTGQVDGVIAKNTSGPTGSFKARLDSDHHCLVAIPDA